MFIFKGLFHISNTQPKQSGTTQTQNYSKKPITFNYTQPYKHLLKQMNPQ